MRCGSLLGCDPDLVAELAREVRPGLMARIAQALGARIRRWLVRSA